MYTEGDTGSSNPLIIFNERLLVVQAAAPTVDSRSRPKFKLLGFAATRNNCPTELICITVEGRTEGDGQQVMQGAPVIRATTSRAFQRKRLVFQ